MYKSKCKSNTNLHTMICVELVPIPIWSYKIYLAWNWPLLHMQQNEQIGHIPKIIHRESTVTKKCATHPANSTITITLHYSKHPYYPVVLSPTTMAMTMTAATMRCLLFFPRTYACALTVFAIVANKQRYSQAETDTNANKTCQNHQLRSRSWPSSTDSISSIRCHYSTLLDSIR